MDLTLDIRKQLVFLGIILLASLQAHSHTSESDVSSILGMQFDVEKLSAIEDLENECRALDTYEEPLSDSCVDRLAEHFSEQPVWEQSIVFYPWADRSMISASALNGRPMALMFTKSEVTGDVPRWRDIFDGNVKERKRIVDQVLQDETCTKLRERGAIHSDSVLSDRCQSRELVKYAIYLDACVTGVERIDDFLVRRYGLDRLTRYEHVSHALDSNLPKEKSEIAKAKLNDTIMHAIWMRNACEHMPIEGYDNAFRSYGWNAEEITFDDMAEELQSTHDAAMSIAARSGDAWAIRGFYVNKLRRDVDYWKSLYSIDPLLFHRWMTELGSVYDLSEEERAMHAMKAYELEKDVLDDPDLDHYIHRHGIWPESANIRSLRERPIEDDQLLKKWVDAESAEM